MASAGDKFVVEEAISPQDNTNLFQSKKWAFVPDTLNQGGNFGTQSQINLATFANQGNWTDLSQGKITFPIKLSIKNTAGGVAVATLTEYTLGIQNGYFQFIDSIQLQIGNEAIQTPQIYTNLDVSYKVLTEWSQDTLNKYGDSLGVAVDEFAPPGIKATGTATFVAPGLTGNEPLDNVPKIPSDQKQGVELASDSNSGMWKRNNMNNSVVNATTTTLAQSILGTNHATVGKSNVQLDKTLTTAGSEIYVMYALATVRLKDISDFASKCPPLKNLTGYLYINYNMSEHSLAGTGIVLSAAPTNTIRFGHSCPGMLNISAVNGLSLHASTSQTLTVNCEVSGAATDGTTLTKAQPIQQDCRLYLPQYTATPEIDRLLTQKKTIRYLDRITGTFNMTAGQSLNQTLTSGISNIKRITLLPIFTGPGSSGNEFIADPSQSLFDIAGKSGSSPFAALTQLQFLVANQPLFNTPISMDWETFLDEVGEDSLDGGFDDKVSSGLLSQRLWNTLYRFYTVNAGRRLNSEDGATKSVQVSLTNATLCPMRVYWHIIYEKEISIDTASCAISRVR